MLLVATSVHLRDIKVLVQLVGGLTLLAVSAFTSWRLAVRERRRIRESTGQEASDAALVSLNNWMKVEDAEQAKDIVPNDES